jgi:hypothetical protein
MNNVPEFIRNIDWSLLREQKRTLVHTLFQEEGGCEEFLNNLEGIVNLIDALQDYAVDALNLNENDVFDFELEESRDEESLEHKFAREYADSIFQSAIEGEWLYDCGDVEGLTKEIVKAIVDDEYHSTKIKENIKMEILIDMETYPDYYKVVGIVDIHSTAITNEKEIKYSGFVSINERFIGLVDNYVEQEYYKTKTKTVYLCSHCTSDDIMVRINKNLKTDKVYDTIFEGKECYCNDCELDGFVVKKEIPYLHRVIGFQVLDIRSKHSNLLIHQNMNVYSLSQANQLIESRLDKDGNSGCKILTIWSDDIFEPVMMFGGDPQS